MSTQDFRPPHEERRTMHSGDAERLEDLREMWELASTEAVALQRDLRELSDKASEVRSRLRKQIIVENSAKKAYDSFRAAMEGMGCKL